MQVIDIGICVNNIDPKGLGRVRYRPYSLFMSEIANNLSYKAWDEKDPFIANPFLPLHVNVVPQVKQSVKLIRYDTTKETQNVEYVAGPFSSPHDLIDQTFTSQHKNTTYGGAITKDSKDIRSADGKFNNPSSEGTMPKENDVGLQGNYGSDVIFTENGIQIRGGSLLSKQGKKKESIIDYPQLAKKMGRFSLKKFSKSLKNVKETSVSESISVSRLKYIVEYEIDSLTTPTQLSIFVYKVLPSYGVQFNTDVFSEESIFNPGDTDLVKLINTEDTTTDATYIRELSGTIAGANSELRDVLYMIDMEGLSSLDNTYDSGFSHPFYYRPTTSFRLTKGNDSTEATNKETFLNNVQVRNKVMSGGLIFSNKTANPPIIATEKVINVAKEVKSGGEQSFSNLSADRVYLTSTSPNVGTNVKTINFTELDPYELTQDDYMNKIEPNTYGMVRGENLYNVLIATINLIYSHIHNINEPLVKTDPNWVKLNELVETLRNDLLNDSLRIN